MTILIVWAVIAGQQTFASHEFGNREACARVREAVIQQIKHDGGATILAICTDRPAS